MTKTDEVHLIRLRLNQTQYSVNVNKAIDGHTTENGGLNAFSNEQQ